MKNKVLSVREIGGQSSITKIKQNTQFLVKNHFFLDTAFRLGHSYNILCCRVVTVFELFLILIE